MRPPQDAPPSELIGRKAAQLRDAFVAASRTEPAELLALADQIAISLPLAARDRDQLARVLSVPPRLALRWIQETIGLLRTAPALHEISLVVSRLDVLAWAWGEIPVAWDAATEERTLRAWTGELGGE